MELKFSPSIGDCFNALLGATSTLKTKEGFLVQSIPNSRSPRSTGFEKVVRSFLGNEHLPFADVLSAERIQRVFAKHGNLFALDGIYTTAVMVWSFLGQVLSDGKQASCQTAVARIVSYCLLTSRNAPTDDTGDYCKARAKLSEHALRELSCEVAGEMEMAAKPSWRWKKLHPKLIDGFTFTMPDTSKNQSEYPQQDAQAPGVGQPIARVVAILSLTTACILDATLGPYKGKLTGETSLLRRLIAHFGHGDVAVMDRIYCSYMMDLNADHLPPYGVTWDRF